MRKIILYVAVLFVQGLFAQITLTPFTGTISSTFFSGSLDAYANKIVVFGGYSHDLTQSRVFVFEKNGNTITQEAYFTPADAALNDNFGTSVSIDHDFIAAGSRYNDQFASNAGAVYMFRKVASNWMFFQKLIPFDGASDDNFGTTVKVVGNQLFVHSPNNDPIGLPANSGALYIYNFNGTSWVFSQKITPSSNNYNGSASTIQVSNNKLVIKGDSTLNTYTYDGTLWNFSSSLITVSSIVDFGLDNNQLFVLQMEGFTSSMKIYDDVANNWNLNTTLTSLQYNDKMATNFKVHNDVMFISLNFHALLYTAPTPVAVYRKIGGSWSFQEYIYGQGPVDRDDDFGTQMAISDDIVVIGAPREFLPNADGGRAYTFDVALGVNENTFNDLKIYPNPTSGIVNMGNDFVENINTIDIYQCDGKLIKSIESNFDSISLSEFQSGIYLLKFTLNNGTSTIKKIIKI